MGTLGFAIAVALVASACKSEKPTPAAAIQQTLDQGERDLAATDPDAMLRARSAVTQLERTVHADASKICKPRTTGDCPELAGVPVIGSDWDAAARQRLEAFKAKLDVESTQRSDREREARNQAAAQNAAAWQPLAVELDQVPTADVPLIEPASLVDLLASTPRWVWWDPQGKVPGSQDDIPESRRGGTIADALVVFIPRNESEVVGKFYDKAIGNIGIGPSKGEAKVYRSFITVATWNPFKLVGVMHFSGGPYAGKPDLSTLYRELDKAGK